MSVNGRVVNSEILKQVAKFRYLSVDIEAVVTVEADV